jgi:hypothetical protein
MPFVIRGLEAEAFAPLFLLSEGELEAIGAQRIHADKADAYPCRISLVRAEVGEELLLVNHVHQPMPTSPYRAAGPIYIGRSAQTGFFRNELPPILRNRLLSLRAYDEAAQIVDCEVAEGEEVLRLIERFFSDPQVAHIDAHYAKPGCFAVRIERG